MKDFDAGRFEAALSAFKAAHALQPSARTFRGIGLASYSLGDFVSARRAFERALIDPRRPLTTESRHEVESLLRETAQRTGRFELRVEPGHAVIELDGAAVTDRELTLSVGSHVLVVTADGHEPFRSTLQVAGGEVETRRITLTVGRSAPPGPSPAASVRALPKSPEPAPPRAANPWPWILLGSSPLFAASAATAWFVGKGKRDAIDNECKLDNCSQEDADRRVADANLSTYETLTSVFIGASIASAAGGVAWLLLSPSRKADSAAVSVGVGGSFVMVTGRY